MARIRRFSTAARRARLVVRHRLAGGASGAGGSAGAGVVDLAASLVGLHATDPATPFLSVRARIPGTEVTELEDALYERRELTKHLCMRRTMFVQADELLPVVHAACTVGVARTQRRRLTKEVEAGGVAADGDAWLRRVEAAALAALAQLGPSTGSQLSKAVPELRAKLTYGEGRRWGGEVGVVTQVLTVLSADGRIRRGRPGGAWTSSQHRWELVDEPIPPLEEAEAQRDLVERWLRAFGPATLDDLTWWTGLGVNRVRRALGRLEVDEVDLDGGPGIVLAGDAGEDEAVADPRPALLPALDSTTMGWKRREWYLGGHGPRLFDRNGNAGPTIWYGGRIVGGWSQRRSGEVVTALLEDIGAAGSAAVEEEAARLQAWLGAAVVTPRFPTPLDRELRA